MRARLVTAAGLAAVLLAPAACGGGTSSADGGSDGAPPSECVCCDGTVVPGTGSCDAVCPVCADGGSPRDAAARPDAARPDAGPPSGCVEDLTPSWVTAAAPAVDVYVSPTGDDANDGATRATALRTVAAAFARIGPGVRLRFTAGTYGCDGAVIRNLDAGTGDPAIILSADGPRMARFDCAGGSGFLFELVRGLIVDGIELSSTSGHGIQISSGTRFDPGNLSEDIVITRSFIHDTGLACVKASQARALGVHFTECARANPSRMMFEFVAVDDVTLANDEGHSAGAFDEIKGGAMGGRIYHNYVHDTANGIFVGGDCTGAPFLVHTGATYEASNLRVWNNVLANVGSEAFRIVSCHDCVVANNTYFTETPGTAMRIIASGFASGAGGSCDDVPTDNRNLTIVNNVFAATSRFSYMIPTNQPAIPGMTMTHNLWFAGSGNDVASIGSDVPFTGEPSSIYSVDPELAAPPGDLSPAAGSPLLGVGTDVPFVGGGWSGCWDGDPNIGAY